VRIAALGVATEPAVELRQHDIFYRVESGRLKLRQFPEGPAELIRYQRADTAGPKTSNYDIFRTDDGQALHGILTAALGIRGEVTKVRTLVMVGRTRIHLDEVEGLGSFLELEVVLAEGEHEAAGQAEADVLMEKLGIGPDDLVTGAYIDLLDKLP